MPRLTLLEAIARQEGFYLPHSRSARNNNPGNINWSSFAEKHGATRIETVPAGETPRFAFFPDAATGFAALRALFEIPGHFSERDGRRYLLAGYAGATLAEALARYAPAADHNDVSTYQANICAWLGCTPETPISQLLGEPLKQVIA